jgi:hypothetical protein
MKRRRPVPVVVGIVALLGALPACKSEKAPPQPAAQPQAPAHEHGHAPAATPPGELPPGVNPVQNEMRVLHEATLLWVTAVANNTLDAIPASIEKIHVARSLTEKALEAGTYKPPKNGDQLEAFIKADEAFHDDLVGLVKASQAKDLPGTTRQLGKVLEGCTSCHTQFRF